MKITGGPHGRGGREEEPRGLLGEGGGEEEEEEEPRGGEEEEEEPRGGVGAGECDIYRRRLK